MTEQKTQLIEQQIFYQVPGEHVGGEVNAENLNISPRLFF